MRKRLSILFVLLVAAAIPASVAAERTVRLAFPVEAGATLKMDTYRGSIDIQRATDDQIHVEAHIDPGTSDKAESEKMLARMQLEIKQVGDTVSVIERNPRETGVRFLWEGMENVSLAYFILVPQGCNLDITTNDGGITIGNLTGRVTARAKKGAIFLRRIDGDVHAETDHGDIILSHCTGTASLKAFIGNIRAGTIIGRADVQTTNGDIDVQHALGGLNAIAEVGDVTADFPAALSGDSSIKTNGGAITVRIDPKARCYVQASSVWGRVRTTLPIAVESGGNDKRNLAGRLNGGGPRMVIHADGGQVHIDPPRI